MSDENGIGVYGNSEELPSQSINSTPNMSETENLIKRLGKLTKGSWLEAWQVLSKTDTAIYASEDADQRRTNQLAELELLEKSGWGSLALELTREQQNDYRGQATLILEDLNHRYGTVGSIPDNDPKLCEARMLLGVYDNDFVETDTITMRERINRVGRVAGWTYGSVIDELLSGTTLYARTIKTKILNNSFTIKERRLMWQQLIELEKRFKVPYKGEEDSKSLQTT